MGSAAARNSSLASACRLGSPTLRLRQRPWAEFCSCSASRRWVALALLPPLVGAIGWVHGANGWVFTATRGGWEYPAYLIIASLAQALLGNGALALVPSSGVAAGRRAAPVRV